MKLNTILATSIIGICIIAAVGFTHAQTVSGPYLWYLSGSTLKPTVSTWSVAIGGGGTGTTTQVTNGVNYYDGTRITSSNNFTYDGSTHFTVKLPNGGVAQLSDGAGTGSAWTTNLGLITGAASQVYLASASTNNLNFSTGATRDTGTFGTVRATISGTTGNLGIATSTPWALLSVAGSAGGSTPLFTISSSTAGFATSSVFQISQNGNIYLQQGNWASTTPAALNFSNIASPTGIAMYNTSDQVTNYERMIMRWNGNISYISNNAGGTGTPRAIRIGTVASAGTDLPVNYLNISTVSTTGLFQLVSGNYGGAAFLSTGNSSLTGSTVPQYFFNLTHSVSQTGTAGFNSLSVQVTETSIGSGLRNLLHLGTSTAPDLFNVNDAGNVGIATSSPVANFQVNNPNTNSTTTMEIGNSTYTKGSCLKLYRTDGSAIYAYVAAGATTFTLTTAACATVTGF